MPAYSSFDGANLIALLSPGTDVTVSSTRYVFNRTFADNTVAQIDVAMEYNTTTNSVFGFNRACAGSTTSTSLFSC